MILRIQLIITCSGNGYVLRRIQVITRINGNSLLIHDTHTTPWVGVTKAPFAIFSVSKIFDLAKVPVRFFESHSYFTGVTAAQLR